ncbi:sigma-70 family RNA polymerase sigma factor [Flavobacterium amniphilum]|uniref:RNA polymerase sigma factor n=1 Tax=Flavobacterium amniphilum TaxID=1834035 RepID=UPI00202A177B|nr:sigma-70 family RNA polymerase sigma factor [Flavobacterium amniphilum]MCL9806191.1 sigma-70 family RNA polymerase sigma factor [Flavobacterium amniphilum]
MSSTENQFKDIYSKYSQKVHRLCLGYTGDAMQADDLLQEVFIKVWENLEKFRGESQMSTWIYRIAVNTCLLHLRSNKKQTKVNVEDLSSKISDETNEMEAQVQLLYKCISELNETDRLIITLLLEEVPYPEIAEVTSISEGNLRVKIHRIKQQLSTIYSKYERL